MSKIPTHWRTNLTGTALTTIKIGGPITYFSQPSDLESLRQDLRAAAALNLPVMLLGGGSNLILSDQGFIGLLIQPALNSREIQSEQSCYLGAGLPWGQAVSWTLANGWSGLHWYARIPCRVGGAIYNNIHGDNHLLAEQIQTVHGLDRQSLQEVQITQAECQFAYDKSCFQDGRQIILGAVFQLKPVDKVELAAAKEHYTRRALLKSKTQPNQASAGSVFRNLVDRPDLPSLSAGWYIDQCGLKGHQVGGLMFAREHANFIINHGGGRQSDFLELVRLAKDQVRQRFQIELRLEVEPRDQRGQIMES